MRRRAPVRTLVVDDEPPAREQLLALLAEESEIECVGEAAGGSEAVRLIRKHRPDLLFLDVQMPGLDGFGVLRAVAPDVPAVVFVTAYDEHAIRAFDVSALDYLLKPVGETRFRTAVRRAVARVRHSDGGEIAAQLSALLERLPSPSPAPLPIWAGGRVVFVQADDVDWIDASDDHVRLHVGKATHVTRDTMTAMEARLPRSFVRIHRSAIVNTARIREVQPWFKGDYVVILRDGTRLTTGRTYRDRLRALLG